jgi:glycosyltransferase involved in cell wall biosynthesis
MRVAINCLRLDPSFVGGVNTYARGLLEGFANTADGHQFQLYATNWNQGLFESFRHRKNFEVIVLDERTQSLRKSICRAALLSFSEKVYESTSNLLFRGIRELMDRDADIVYTPTNFLQCFNSQKPTVLSMHDIQHVHYPEFFSWPRRLSRRITYGLSARHARFFQASSEFTKQDLLRHFRCISAEQIAVIPEGVRVEEFATPVDTTSLRSRYALPERFLLYPAQLWLHKNHMILLQALKQIESRLGLQIPLVLTGGKYSSASRVLGYIADQSMNYVHYLGQVPFTDLVGLYQKAAFLVMPSLHESNSLPVLEAAAAGTPVIASRIPPNEELARVLHLNLFDPLNQEELEGLLVRLWEDESAAVAQAMHNRKNIALYSWDSSAGQYLQLFERILKEKQ